MKKTLLVIFLIPVLLAAGCGSAAGFSQEDLYLDIDGAKYYLNTDVNEVIETLGAEYEYSETKSCDYDGLDKAFLYDIAEFYTYPLETADMLSEVYTEYTAAETSRGISVGATKEEILGAYGEDCEDTGYQIIYSLPGEPADGGSLCFDMESGVVAAMYVTNRAQ